MTRLYRSFFLLVFAAGMAAAQDPRFAATRPANTPVPEDRAAMLRQLGLTPVQVRQLRAINQSRRPAMEAAQIRLRQANQALDTAIYADVVNDVDIQAKLRAVHEAQAEVVRIRSTNELAIRKLLSNDQLQKFRMMRLRFEQARNDRNISPIRPRANRRRGMAPGSIKPIR